MFYFKEIKKKRERDSLYPGSIRAKPQKASEIYHQLPKATTLETDQVVCKRLHVLIRYTVERDEA